MGSALIRDESRPYMGRIYGQLVFFSYALGKTPIYGVWHPFVFNNTGKAHPHGMNLAGLSPFLNAGAKIDRVTP
jgi:hypothetical protein